MQFAAAARLIVADFTMARRLSQQREVMRCLSEACALGRGRDERATQHADRYAKVPCCDCQSEQLGPLQVLSISGVESLGRLVTD